MSLDGTGFGYNTACAVTAADLAPYIDEQETGREWTFAVPVTEAVGWLNMNTRTDRRKEPARRRHFIEQGKTLAAAHLPHRSDQLARVRIICVCRWSNNIRRDPGNYTSTAKAIVDGMVMTGFVPDDNWRHVVGPDMRRGPNYTPLPYGPIGEVVVIVRELAVPADLPAPPRATARAPRKPRVAGLVPVTLTAAQRQLLPPGARVWTGPKPGR